MSTFYLDKQARVLTLGNVPVLKAVSDKAFKVLENIYLHATTGTTYGHKLRYYPSRQAWFDSNDKPVLFSLQENTEVFKLITSYSKLEELTITIHTQYAVLATLGKLPIVSTLGNLILLNSSKG